MIVFAFENSNRLNKYKMRTTQKAHRKVVAIIESFGNSGMDVEITEVKSKNENAGLSAADYKKAKFTKLSEKELEKLKDFYNQMRRMGIFFQAKFTKTTAEFNLADKFESFNDPKLRPSLLSVDSKDVYATKTITVKSNDKKSRKVAKVPKKIRVAAIVCEFKDKFVVVFDKSGTPIDHLCGMKDKELTAAISEYTQADTITNIMDY